MFTSSTLLLGLLSSGLTLAAPSVAQPAEQVSIPYVRRGGGLAKRGETADDRMSRLTAGVRGAHIKYGLTPNTMSRKRAPSGNVQLADVEGDV